MAPASFPWISTPSRCAPRVRVRAWRTGKLTIQQEYTKRPRTEPTRKYLPHHVAHPSQLTLQECLALSDVVISAVPTAAYKVKTEWLKEGCIVVNVAADKNFEKDVRDKVRMAPKRSKGDSSLTRIIDTFTGFNLHSGRWESYHFDAPPELVRIFMAYLVDDALKRTV